MNPDNIQRVIDQLLIEPDSRVEMENFWSSRNDDAYPGENGLIACDYYAFKEFSKDHSCETAACLAGWVVHLWNRADDDPIFVIEEIFDIPMMTVLGLCYSEHWCYFPAYKEFHKANAEHSEREALIFLLTKLKNNELVVEDCQLLGRAASGVLR